MIISPLKALGAALLFVLPASTVAQPPKDRAERLQRNEPAPRKAGPDRPGQQESYGHWDKSWGSRPPAPPKHWTKKGDWHRHVRACQKKYRSYNPRSDTYRTSTGKTRRCPV